MWGMKTQKSPVKPKMSQFCHVHSLVATLDVTGTEQPGQVSSSGRSPQTRGREAEEEPPVGAAGDWRSLPSRGAPSPAGRDAELMAMGAGERGKGEAGIGTREGRRGGGREAGEEGMSKGGEEEGGRKG